MDAAPSASGRDTLQQPHSAYDLLLANQSLQPITRKIERAGLYDVPVLIVGESGTGKELVAKAIHQQSSRAHMPFVCLNLAAIPIELAEAVLFGHEKGAFTGACHASPGYCRKADRGTLFLDEIGETDWSLQSKLLRFLQSHEIQPVGSQHVTTVDVRIVAATNRDLVQAVRARKFREDLFYRLNVVQIPLPPLRERLQDIDGLIDYFLQEFNVKFGASCQLSSCLRQRLHEAHWPGNIRQLRSIVENLVLFSDHDTLGIQDLSSELMEQIGTRTAGPTVTTAVTSETELDRLTHQLVDSVLEQTPNVEAAAKRLGISRSTLYRWIKRYRHDQGSPAVDRSAG